MTVRCECEFESVTYLDTVRSYGCRIHVACDDGCQALKEPATLPEFLAALEHWRGHGWLSACSHGS